MSGRIAGKTAIITGAGSGIGRASALLFAKEGATVVVNDINASSAEYTVRQIKAGNGQASVYIADVTSADQVEGMIADVVNQYGRLDVMFNNAGGAMPKATHELTADDYRSIIALNLDSVFFCTLSALRIMMRQRRG